MLPQVTLELRSGRWLGFQLNAALAWWLFSGLVVLSYTLFLTGWAQQWAIDAQFIPLYGLLAFVVANRLIKIVRPMPVMEPTKEVA
jgi:hypothetical protein